MKTFNSFNELVAFSASQNKASLDVFNFCPLLNEDDIIERIYDHLVDDGTVKPGIRRMPEEEINKAVLQCIKTWKELKTIAERDENFESVKTKVNQFEAESEFRKQLAHNRHQMEKYLESGIKGILFEQPLINLWPYDPHVLSAGLMTQESARPKRIKNQVECV